MDCCTCFAKYVLCLFNFVLFVVGSVVLSVGIWLAADKTSFLQITRLHALLRVEQASDQAKHVVEEFSEPSLLDHTAYILIAIGAFIFIISFLGYCGALQENRVLLTAYGLFLLIIFALQITGIVLSVVYRTQADEQVRVTLKKSISNSYTTKNSRDAITLSWDLVMTSMECCGVNNYTDFSQARKFVAASREEGVGRKVPEACCILQGDHSLLQPADENCVVSPSTTNSYLFKGCYNKFLHLVSENLNLVFGCLVGVGAVQFVAIVFAFCICKLHDGDDREMPYYK
eukprot:GFUD01037150.1.p1 GENE.GFUD01037150.1~~GFUD01037150.1.p1  ORF type:complete len:287 (+),score=63.87 GFUD01037150.1:215-1075(+)